MERSVMIKYKSIILFSTIFAFQRYIPNTAVSAYEKSGVVAQYYSWEIENDELSMNDLNGNWSCMINKGSCVFSGSKLDTYDDIDSSAIEENIELFEWNPEPQVINLIIAVDELASGIGTDLSLINVSKLEIYRNVKKIDNDTLYGFSSLSDVFIFNDEVELDLTGLGYNEDKSKKNNLTIYGYRNSKAQRYALENGFDFVAFDIPYENSSAGDINSDGKADISDITELSLHLIGDISLSEHEKMLADVDYDGFVTLADLAKLQQYLSKKIDVL